jgi:hypothetical protein
MDRQATTGTANPGSRTNKRQHVSYTTIANRLKAEFIRVLSWCLSAAGGLI